MTKKNDKKITKNWTKNDKKWQENDKQNDKMTGKWQNNDKKMTNKMTDQNWNTKKNDNKNDKIKISAISKLWLPVSSLKLPCNKVSRTGRVEIVGVGVEIQPSTPGPDPGGGAELSNLATS